MPFRHAFRRRPQRGDPPVLMAERTAKPRRQIFAETGRQRRGGARSQIADRLQPGARQRHHRLRGQDERRGRQPRDRLRIASGGHDAAAPEPGDGMRGLRRAGDGTATMQPRSGHPVGDERKQAGLAAEEMSAAGDVEHQPVRGIERHQRRETLAIGRKPGQEPLVLLGLGGQGGQVRDAGARIGQGQAARQAQSDGTAVAFGQFEGPLLARDEDHRRLSRRGVVGCPDRPLAPAP